MCTCTQPLASFLLMPLNAAHMITGVAFRFIKISRNRRWKCLCFENACPPIKIYSEACSWGSQKKSAHIPANKAVVKYDLFSCVTLLLLRYRLQIQIMICHLCPLSGPRRRTWRTQTQRRHPATSMQRHRHQFPGQKCVLCFSVACLHVCVLVYAFMLFSVAAVEAFVPVCLRWNALLLFIRDIPRSNLHEPFIFPDIVLFNTNHVMCLPWLT